MASYRVQFLSNSAVIIRGLLRFLCRIIIQNFLYEAETLKIQKQPPEVFKKKSFSLKLRKIHRKTPVRETLAEVFYCEFCEIFKNTIFTEHLRETASENKEVL